MPKLELVVRAHRNIENRYIGLICMFCVSFSCVPSSFCKMYLRRSCRCILINSFRVWRHDMIFLPSFECCRCWLNRWTHDDDDNDDDEIILTCIEECLQHKRYNESIRAMKPTQQTPYCVYFVSWAAAHDSWNEIRDENVKKRKTN